MAQEMKDSGVKWLGMIPKDWKIKRGKYNFEKHKFIPGSRSEQYDRLALTMKGVIHRSKDDVDGLQPKDFATYQLLRKDELVFKLIDLQNISTSRVGLSPYTGLVSPAYIVIRAIDEIIPKFAEKYYLMLWYRNIFNILGDDGIRSNLSAVDLLNVPVCYPAKNEQEVIADFLDKKCAEIDGLLADLEAEVKTLAEYKKSIIAETVTRGLNPNAPMKQSGIPWAETIPAHWTTAKGKYLFVLRRTKGNPHNLELMSPTQKFGVIPQSQVEGVVLVKEKTDLNTFRTIRPGDFCISLRSFQGGFEYSQYEGVVSPAYQVFYPIKPIADGYFKYMFKSDGFISYINTFSMSLRDGKNIAFEDFGNSYIPTPPIEEQEAIAAYLNKKCAMIDQSTADKQTQIETLKSYKSSLIYEYVTGKKQVI